MKMKTKCLAFAASAIMSVTSATFPWELAADQHEILTVLPDGSFSNTNVTERFADRAFERAQEKIDQTVAASSYAAATNARHVVDAGLAEIAQGAYIEYSDLFVWSAGSAFSGKGTNSACRIYDIKLHPEITNFVDGVAHFAVDVSYWFAFDIGSYRPYVKYSTSYEATNGWTKCVQDAPVGPFEDVTPDGVTVANAYRTRNWCPVAWSGAFFKAFADADAPGTGEVLEIENGVKGGYTGEHVFPLANGKYLYLSSQGGVLTNLEVKDEAP